METIKWSGKPSAPDYDWCGKYQGKYVDLTRSYDGTWSYHYDNQRIQSGFTTRERAHEKLLDFLVDK